MTAVLTRTVNKVYWVVALLALKTAMAYLSHSDVELEVAFWARTAGAATARADNRVEERMLKSLMIGDQGDLEWLKCANNRENPSSSKRERMAQGAEEEGYIPYAY